MVTKNSQIRRFLTSIWKWKWYFSISYVTTLLSAQLVGTGEKCKGLSFESYNITYNPEREKDFWTEMEYPNGTRATVTCEDGFEIFPLRPIITNAATTVCVNGQWKPDIVNCTAARCSCTKLPQEMIERKRKLKCCDQFAPSGTYNQWTECEEGYKAEGNYRARCCFGVWCIHTPVTQYNRCIRRESGANIIHESGMEHILYLFVCLFVSLFHHLL